MGRFIRERAGQEPVPPVLCLTATAKPDVKAEIEDYFQEELGIKLKVFDGGAQRTNLEFVVVQTSSEGKFADIHQIIEADLPTDEPGGAIVYCATRRQAEEIAEFLQAKGRDANYFHAGLLPETKKNVQESFIRGDLRAIVATKRLRHGHRQAGRADRDPRRHPGFPGELPTGSGARWKGPAEGALRAALHSG